MSKYPNTMEDSPKFPVLTAESKAKDLGGRIVFKYGHTEARDFPTRLAAKEFQIWLEERKYSVAVINPYTSFAEIWYTAPQASLLRDKSYGENIIQLRDRREP